MGSCLSSSNSRRCPIERSNSVAIEPSSNKAVIPTNSSAVMPSEGQCGTNNVESKSMIHEKVEDVRQITSYGNVNIFTYDELAAATKNFQKELILGEGGFGLVYKGFIAENVRPGFKSMFVAVKDLNRDGLQGDREWLEDKLILLFGQFGQLSHPNLVKLIGCCCEDDHRLLVYEYMAHGSLDKHLFQRASQTISWPFRIKIALDAAIGLAFLHEAERPIIYRDFKTSNILLDSDYNAKLSDFGLAKEGPTGDKTHVSTRVMGTYGYAAPEYVMTGHLTSRSDVYAFGVVLLEMLVGRKALDARKLGGEVNLVEWARPLLVHCNKLLRIIDPRMAGQYSNKAVHLVSNLAYQCLCENPKGRPTMSEVVKVLRSCQIMNEQWMVHSCHKAPIESSTKTTTGSHSELVKVQQP
ncbi:hypothetical protein HPP92_010421 [Vanilla planifolia]|uniref:non-specific serine/threonine protein kinase n=1 Tax=Vanilla planifolia TaxID=51239 RepID=A0A835QX54_VANPL|nr:hypothetical protein HPP92_010421 [Vanilla planifolia]